MNKMWPFCIERLVGCGLIWSGVGRLVRWLVMQTKLVVYEAQAGGRPAGEVIYVYLYT